MDVSPERVVKECINNFAQMVMSRRTSRREERREVLCETAQPQTSLYGGGELEVFNWAVTEVVGDGAYYAGR